MKLVCSARIPNAAERKAMMAWVACVGNGGYSENGDTINLTYIGDATDPDHSGRYWGIIHTIEQYAEHSISSSEN